jgi:hypothetical protein
MTPHQLQLNQLDTWLKVLVKKLCSQLAPTSLKNQLAKQTIGFSDKPGTLS